MRYPHSTNHCSERRFRAATVAVALLVSVGCPSRGALDNDRRPRFEPAADTRPVKDPDSIRIATFNVHRFFDTVCDSGRCGDGDYEALPTASEFGRRADELSTAIAELDADIVLLQEIETQSGLDALQSRLSDRYPVAVLGEIGTPASVDVAVLSRGRLMAVETHRETPLLTQDGDTTWFSREFLEVHIALAADSGGSVSPDAVVFSAHFRSQRNDDPDRRLAEALAARDIVLSAAEEAPSALVVFGGDLNDTPDSYPIQAIEQGGELFRVASELEPTESVTYFYGAEGKALDHMFLALTSSGSYIPGSAFVVRDGPGRGYGGSDHAALMADFAHEAADGSAER